MMRNVVIGAALAAVGLLAGYQVLDRGRAGAQADNKAAAAPYAHVVIFYLKPDAPKNAAEEMIADAHGMLAKIPTVRSIRIGRPAEMATPDFAKKDYQLGLLVLCDDYNGLKTYLDHPLHTKYVEKHLKHVDEKKLLVYDFINQTK